MLDHITLLNLNLLYVKGRSDLALRLEIIKKTIAITILVISIQWGVIGICWGRVLYSIIATIINTYYTKRLIQLSLLQHLKDIIPLALVASAMGIVVLLVIQTFDASSTQLIVGIIVGIVVYSILALLFFRDILKELKSLMLSRRSE